MTRPSPQYLAHFGVKGMKWGMSQKSSSGGDSSGEAKGSSKKQKPTTDEIKSARSRQGARFKQVQKDEDSLIVAKTDSGKKAAAKVLEKSYNEALTNPDAAIASRITRGEKVGAAFTYGTLAVSAAFLLAART